METSKEVALTICEKIQNEYHKVTSWQTMLEIEDLIDKHVSKQLHIHGVVGRSEKFICYKEDLGNNRCSSQCVECGKTECYSK